MTSTLILGFALVVLTYVAAEFTYGVPGKTALDFGLGIASLSSIGIAIFMGATLIAKEVENRTVYMVLSRPIARYSFLIGRILGMILILFLNILVLCSLALLCFKYYKGEIDSSMIWCSGFIFLESVLVLLVVIFFSLITNTIMAIIYSLVIYVLGHAVENVYDLYLVKSNPALTKMIEIYSTFFPNLSKINIKSYILYEQKLTAEFLHGGLKYGVAYMLMLLLACAFIFDRKNLD